MRRIAILLLAVAVTGCLDAPRAAPGTESSAVLAYVDAPEETGPNRTILAWHEGGFATRLTYLADGSWTPRVAPGLDVDPSFLDVVLGPLGARERGGLVLRVERGEVSADAAAALDPFLQGEWPASFDPKEEIPSWYRPMSFVRVEPRAFADAPPDAPQHLDAEDARLAALAGVFARLRDSFVAASTENAQLPFFEPWDGCLRATTTATPPAARVGETVAIRVELVNCAETEVVLDPQACTRPPSAMVQLSAPMATLLAVMPATQDASAAYALDLVCRGDAAAMRIAPGQNATLTRVWNGTLASCRAGGACEHRAAPSGEYAFFTFATGQTESTPAMVTLLGADAPSVRLLLARERDWLNTTSQQPLEAYFGPHCAPASYTTDPASLTIWHYGAKPNLTRAVVVRDWREGPRPDGVATFSADRLDLLYVPDEPLALASPFDRDFALANVTLDAGAFVVDGTRLTPGETHVVRVVRMIERGGATYETTSEIELVDLGDAAVVWQQAGGCA